MNWFWKSVFVLMLIVASALVGGIWFAGGYRVSSGAMAPLIAPGDLVVVNRASPRGRSPKRGDVVLFQLPDQEGQAVRRVLGLPGEQIEVRNDEVFVDGVKFEEPYRAAAPGDSPPARPFNASPANYGPVTVPIGAYFVLGDNRHAPADSRQFGFVSQDRLVGRVWTFFKKPLTL